MKRYLLLSLLLMFYVGTLFGQGGMEPVNFAVPATPHASDPWMPATAGSQTPNVIGLDRPLTRNVRVSLTPNYTKFSAVKTVADAASKKANKGYESHPEYGLLFPGAPCDQCYELIDERTAYTKTFEVSGTNKKITQTSTQPMHYKDANGNWRTIREQLLPDEGSKGVYAIKNEATPIEINTNNSSSEVTLGTNPDQIRFNSGLELIFVDATGTEHSLGKADYSHHTAGDAGVYVTNAWPGVDIEVNVLRGAVKTNYHINKAMPQYSAGRLLIRDHLSMGSGLQLSALPKTTTPGELTVNDNRGIPVFGIGAPNIYQKDHFKSTVKGLNYLVGENNTLDIEIGGEMLNQPADTYPLIVDPLITVTTSTTVNGSTYITALTATSGCLYLNAANTPANCTITDIQFQFQYTTVSPMALEYGGSFFYLGTCRSPGTLAGGLIWSCASVLPGTCTATGGTTYSLFSDLSPCVPAPQCPSYALNIDMYFLQTYARTAACTTTWCYGSQPLIISVLGETVKSNAITVTGGTTICQGASTVLNATATWGVPPYTFTWYPGGLTGTSITVTPSTTTTYTAIVTDACGDQDSVTKTITVDPRSPITGVTTLCAGNTTTLTDSVAGGTWTSSNHAVATISTGGVVTAVGAGTTTITYTTAGGCTETLVITVTAAPAPITGVTTVCVGNTTNLTDATAGGTWSSGTTGIATIGGTGTVTGISSGTSTIYYSLGGACEDSVTVTVNPNPSAITGTPTMCTGTNDIFTDSVAGGTWSSSNLAVATVSATGNVVAVGPGTAVVTYTLPGGCFTTFTVTVTSTPTPITGDTTVCTGSTIILTDGVAGGTWSSTNTAVATISTGGVVTGVSAGTTTISYAFGASCGVALNVTVLPTPVLTGTTFVDPSNCTSSDGSITIEGLTSGSVYSLTYTFNGTTYTVSATANSAGDLVISGLPGGSCTNIYVVNSVGCTSNTLAGPVVLVQPLPPPPPTVADTTYCQYQSAVQLTATGTGSLLWYSSATGGTGSATAPTPSTTTPGVFHFYVSQTVGPCEGARAEITVTVNAKPAAPSVYPPTYCQNITGVSALSVSPTSGLTWYGPGTTGGYTTTPIPSVAVSGNFTYYVTETQNGCSSDSTVDVVTVIAQPEPPAVTDLSYCVGSVNVPPLTATGTDLTWYANASCISAITDPVPATDSLGTFTWYVTQTANGCASLPANISVTVYSKPQFEVITPRSFVCEYDTLSMVYVPLMFGNFNYTWTLPDGDTLYHGYTAGDSAIIVSFDTLYGKSVTLTVSSGGSCVAIDTVNVQIVPLPAASLYIKPDFCVNDTVTVGLTGRSFNAYNFTWNFDGGTMVAASSNSGGPFSLTWNDTGFVVIQLHVTSPEGCAGPTAFDTAKIHALPDASFGILSAKSPVCLDDSVEFLANTQNYMDYYSWTPASFFNNANQPTIWGKIQYAGIVSLSVTDPYGCTGSYSLNVAAESCCSVFVPSAFVPSATGVNISDSKFGPLFQSNSFHRYHLFQITNRWGQVVFQTTENDIQWDGTFNGVPQDVGVYYWYIEYDCGGSTQTAHGDVTLVR